jgi:hypothetical protein
VASRGVAIDDLNVSVHRHSTTATDEKLGLKRKAFDEAMNWNKYK